MKGILQLYRKLKKLFTRKIKPTVKTVKKIYRQYSDEELINIAKRLFPTGTALNTINISLGATYRDSGFINWERMPLYKFESPLIDSDGNLYLGWDERNGDRRSKVYDSITKEWFYISPEKLVEIELEKARKIFNDE